MDRKKIIYIGIILIITVIISIACFSYAFFTRTDEYHGKLNIVAGTLNYRIKSSLLENNSITLASNEKAKLNIEIESLNEIESKYELFYTSTNNNIEIGYTNANDNSTGNINGKGKKKVTVIIKNKTNTSATITFGVQGGLVSNTLVLNTGRNSINQATSSYCEIAANTVYNFDYTGSEQEFNVPCSGTYKLETWGAQGRWNENAGGVGAYSLGYIDLTEFTTFYVNVGGNRGYNGGGNGSYGSGGGATSITFGENLGELKNYVNNKDKIIIVAAGGGAGYSEWTGGTAGGYIGNDGTIRDAYINGKGATQTAGGSGQEENGSFGLGGTNTTLGSGGGGGYYGGGSGDHSGAGGGASYIGNNILYNKAMYCYNCTENSGSNTYTVSTYGTTTHASERDTTNCPDGYSSNPISKCAKSGDGYARITYLSESVKEEKTDIKYIINFNAGSGAVQPMKVINVDSQIGTLPTPIRGSDYFEGWYLESNFTTRVDSTYVPTSDVTLYARYGTEVNLNLAGRTLGTPSSTASSKSTKRTWNISTYVVGISAVNDYYPNYVDSYSFNATTITIKESSGRSGFNIGIPINISTGLYKAVCDMGGTGSQIVATYYKSDGTFISYKSLVARENYTFTIPNQTSVLVLQLYGNSGADLNTYSNLHLYKLD